jgi:hypothetical protein
MGEVMQVVVARAKSKRGERQRGDMQRAADSRCAPDGADVMWGRGALGGGALGGGALGVIEDDDESAPFAVEEDGASGGRNLQGLRTLLRLLEKKEPRFLVDEGSVQSRGSAGSGGVVGEGAGRGILDTELDHLISMPDASDLTLVRL